MDKVEQLLQTGVAYFMLLMTTDVGLFAMMMAFAIIVVALVLLGLRWVAGKLFRRKGEKERMYNHLMRVYTVAEMQRIFFGNMRRMVDGGVRKGRMTREEGDKLLRHFAIITQQWDQCPKDPVQPPPDPKQLKASLMEKHKNSLTERRKAKVRDIEAEMQALLAN